jgi:hypothetical protein
MDVVYAWLAAGANWLPAGAELFTRAADPASQPGMPSYNR